jgi:hypothetical protein
MTIGLSYNVFLQEVNANHTLKGPANLVECFYVPLETSRRQDWGGKRNFQHPKIKVDTKSVRTHLEKWVREHITKFSDVWSLTN